MHRLTANQMSIGRRRRIQKSGLVFWSLVAFALFAPLTGVVLMEMGAHGPSVGRDGYSNGASIAYGFYVSVAIVVSWLVARARVNAVGTRGHSVPRMVSSGNTAAGIGLVALVINAILLQVILWGADGYTVLLGERVKGEFRIGLGEVGAVAYLITKFLAPALFAYYVVAFRVSEVRLDFRHAILLLMNLVVLVILGAAWGFKTTAISMLFPALILAGWLGLSKRALFVFGTIAVAFIVAGAFYFDDGVVLSEVLIALGIRITIVHGDVFWEIWDGYWNGVRYEGYWKTLAAAVGDRVLSAVWGVWREDWSEWVAWHYDLMLSQLVGRPPEDYFQTGTTITGTPASEGIIALGLSGLLISGVVAGTVIGLTYRIISATILRKPAIAVAATVYFSFVVVPWLIGGGITQLFHVATLTGLLVSLTVMTATATFLRGLAITCRPHSLQVRATQPPSPPSK